MADSVQFVMDRLAHVFRSMEALGVFSPEEVASIVKKRTDYEYVLKRRQQTPGDYYSYLQYEINLEKLRLLRCHKDMQVHARQSKADQEGTSDADKKAAVASAARLKDRQDAIRQLQSAAVRHICTVFERGIRRFPEEIDLVLDYVSFLKDEMTPAPGKGGNSKGKGHEAYLVVSSKSNSGTLNEVFGRALALHPRHEKLWVLAAMHEVATNNNVHAARSLLQRALRVNKHSSALFKHYFELELWHALRLRERRRVLTKTVLDIKGNVVGTALKGSKSEQQLQEEERGYLLGAPVVVFKHALKAVDTADFACELLRLVSSNCASTDDNDDDNTDGNGDNGGVRVASLSAVLRAAVLEHFAAPVAESSSRSRSKELLQLWCSLLRASGWVEDSEDSDDDDEEEEEEAEEPSLGKKRGRGGAVAGQGADMRETKKAEASIANACRRLKKHTAVITEALQHTGAQGGVDAKDLTDLIHTETATLLAALHVRVQPAVELVAAGATAKQPKKKGKTAARGPWGAFRAALEEQAAIIAALPSNDNALAACMRAQWQLQADTASELGTAAAGNAGDAASSSVSGAIEWLESAAELLASTPVGGDLDAAVDAVAELHAAVHAIADGYDSASASLATAVEGLATHLVATEKGTICILNAVAAEAVDAEAVFAVALSSRRCRSGGRGLLAAHYLSYMQAAYTSRGKTVAGALAKTHRRVQKLVLRQPVLLAEGGLMEYYVATLEAAEQEVLRLNGTLATTGAAALRNSSNSGDSAGQPSKAEQAQQIFAIMRLVGDEGLAATGGTRCPQLWDLRERAEELSKSPKQLSAIKWRRARV